MGGGKLLSVDTGVTVGVRVAVGVMGGIKARCPS